MKVWLIYYTGNLDDISMELEETDGNERLYAITSNKKYYKLFMRTRNNGVFKVKKEEMLPSEYNQLVKEFRGQVLDKRELRTSIGNGCMSTEVELILTEHEYEVATEEDLITSMLESDEFWEHSLPPTMYKSKIAKALYILQYIQLRKLAIDTDLGKYDDYESPDICIDELHQFITNFSGTLSI